MEVGMKWGTLGTGELSTSFNSSDSACAGGGAGGLHGEDGVRIVTFWGAGSLIVQSQTPYRPLGKLGTQAGF